MATITWKGEDHLHPDGNGPRFNTWNGVNFEVGKAVDLDDTALKDDVKAQMLAKAKRNAFFDVSDDKSEQEPEKRGPGRPRIHREGEGQ